MAKPYEEKAREHEARGEDAEAHRCFMLAYNYYRLARFPSPNTPAKREAARASVANYLAASKYFEPPLERIAIPFAGRPGEGSEIRAYLRVPQGKKRPPVVVIFGGIDSYKEERHRYVPRLLEQGLACLAIDMPGTGESPVTGSTDAERLFGPILSYLQGRDDLDGARIGVSGSSFGGYWSAKAAHTESSRLKAAVVWGGPIHYAFQPDWIRKSRYARSYLTDLIETRASAFGLKSFDEWLEFAPSFSLLEQGVLDRPHCAMLLVNGKEDVQTPIEDLYLLAEHGGPKTCRVFPGGHMGQTPETYPTIVEWLKNRLLA